MTHSEHTAAIWPPELIDINDNERKELFEKMLPVFENILIQENIPQNPVLIHALKNIYLPFSSWINRQTNQSPLIIGINGSQGSGKSTLSKIINAILLHTFDKNVVSFSIDDFYKTKQQRAVLAKEVHPLFNTRGVPGTHDIRWCINILHELKHQAEPDLLIPVFNKSIDDRAPESDWCHVTTKPDIVILEGWCVGSEAKDTGALKVPVNQLEKEEDSSGIWRKYANEQLNLEYKELFSMIEILVMLQIPDFDKVYEWRLLQEHKLKSANGMGAEKNSVIMNDNQIRRFIMHYERITRHTLQEMPNRAEVLIMLGNDHNIKNVHVKN